MRPSIPGDDRDTQPPTNVRPSPTTFVQDSVVTDSPPPLQSTTTPLAHNVIKQLLNKFTENIMKHENEDDDSSLEGGVWGIFTVAVTCAAGYV